MIRSANHSSFPKTGDHPLIEPLNEARRALAAGEIDREAWLCAVDEATTLCVAEQARAFLEIVTDGMLGWAGPHEQLATAVDGLALGGPRPWFESGIRERGLVVEAALRRRASLCRRTFDAARAVALTQTVQISLPGPVTLARRADDRHYGDLDVLADAFAECLAQEVAELAASGASAFLLEEPMLCRHPEDLDRVARTAGRIFDAAGDGAQTVLSTYFGDLAAVAGDWARLPGTHLGLEATEGSPNLSALERLPDGRGVFLGAFDALRSAEEDADDVIRRLEPHRETLRRRDVIVGPNAGIESLDRDTAFDKLLHARYVAEQLARDWSWEE